MACSVALVLPRTFQPPQQREGGPHSGTLKRRTGRGGLVWLFGLGGRRKASAFSFPTVPFHRPHKSPRPDDSIIARDRAQPRRIPSLGHAPLRPWHPLAGRRVRFGATTPRTWNLGQPRGLHSHRPSALAASLDGGLRDPRGYLPRYSGLLASRGLAGQNRPRIGRPRRNCRYSTHPVALAGGRLIGGGF